MTEGTFLNINTFSVQILSTQVWEGNISDGHKYSRFQKVVVLGV